MRTSHILIVAAALLLAACSGGLAVQGTTNFNDLAVENLEVDAALSTENGPVSLGGAEVHLGDVTLTGNGTQVNLNDAQQVIEMGSPDTGRVVRVEPAGGKVNASSFAVNARLALVGKTADHSLAATDTGALVHTSGATGPVTFTLPAASAGLAYCFYVAAAQPLSVDPASGDQIAALTDATGDRVSASSIGHAVCLAALDNTTWAAYALTGTWADAD